MAIAITAAEKVRAGLDWVRKRLPIAVPTVLARWEVIEDTSGATATAKTDGKKLWYNPRFIDSLSLGETAGLILHEAGHPLYGHPLRFRMWLYKEGIAVTDPRAKRMHKLHNVAADLALNSLFLPLYKEAGAAGLVSKGCFPREGKYAGYPEGRSLDWYLAELIKDNPPPPPPPPPPPAPQGDPKAGEDDDEKDEGGDGGKDGQEEGEDGAAGPQDDGKEDGDGEGTGEGDSDAPEGKEKADTGDQEAGAEDGDGDEGGEGKGEDGDAGSEGEGDEGSGDAEGEGSEGEGDGDGAAKGESKGEGEGEDGENGEGDGAELDDLDDLDKGNVFGEFDPAPAEEDADADPKALLEALEEQERDWKRAVAQAIVMDKSCGSGRGDAITESLREQALIDKPDESAWVVALQRFLTRYAPGGYTYNKLSRRHGWRQDIIMPANQSIGASKGLVIVDTSGSMGDAECDRAFVEMERVLQRYPRTTLKLITCDTKVVEGNEYTASDFPIRDHKGWMGRGGTELAPAFLWAKEYRPDWVVVVTDMGWNYPQAPDPGKPVFWLQTLPTGSDAEWAEKLAPHPIPFGILAVLPPAPWAGR